VACSLALPAENGEKPMKMYLAGLTACLAVVVPQTAMAAWQASPPGFTEFIACHVAFNTQPIHHQRDWNVLAPSTFNSTSLPNGPWWSYAAPGSQDACRNWVRAQVPGGAGFVAGQPSLPQGTLVNLSPKWASTTYPNPTVQSECGHQHVFLYAWGWRYNGSTWAFEYIRSTALSADWNDSTDRCEFRGDIPNGIPGFSYGKGVVSIKNSPYAVLWVMSQASSHRSAGCGQFECFHPVRTTYGMVDTTVD
jgi:hypothetical protein